MFRKRHPQTGACPGTLLIPHDAPATSIRMLRFSPDCATDRWIHDISSLDTEAGQVTWIDVQGFADESVLTEIAAKFNIHPLAMEDIVNVPQRPKVVSYAHQTLIIARAVTATEDADARATQISLVVGSDYVITFRHELSNLFEPVRTRIDNPATRLRKSGADYLAYVILDTAIDSLYPVLARFGERLETIEASILTNPQPNCLQEINAIRNQLMQLRRTIWPLRDAVRCLIHGDSPLMSETAQTFLRDTHDHCEQIADVLEMYRDIATGLLNTYMSAVAHRSNEIMKVLTIISSIFVPMTFVAGVYGMNFEHMPELALSFSYPMVWIIMLTIAVTMLWFFHRKRWLSVSPLNAGDDGSPTEGSQSREVLVALKSLTGQTSTTPDDLVTSKDEPLLESGPLLKAAV